MRAGGGGAGRAVLRGAAADACAGTYERPADGGEADGLTLLCFLGHPHAPGGESCDCHMTVT